MTAWILVLILRSTQVQMIITDDISISYNKHETFPPCLTNDLCRGLTQGCLVEAGGVCDCLNYRAVSEAECAEKLAVRFI